MPIRVMPPVEDGVPTAGGGDAHVLWLNVLLAGALGEEQPAAGDGILGQGRDRLDGLIKPWLRRTRVQQEPRQRAWSRAGSRAKEAQGVCA